jgi:hypothetical protein
MSTKKKPEFKRHFYLQWVSAAWLGDPGLKLCTPEVKAVWMDMLMNMVLTFPFGHMSRLSKPLMRESNLPLVKKILGGSLVYQNPDQNPNQTAYQDPNQDDDQWIRLSVGLKLPEQLSLVVSIEDQIPKLTGYDSVLVKDAIQMLDDLNVFSRTEGGIIYSRRMRYDFEKRKTAFINACKGVNPYEYKQLKRNAPRGLVYQNHDQKAKQGADQTTEQTGDQTGHQNAEGLVGDQPNQSPNYNYNSNYSSIPDSGSNTVNSNESNGIGNTSEAEKKGKVDVGEHSGGGAGSGNGHLKPIDFTGLKEFKAKLLDDKAFTEPFLMVGDNKSLTMEDLGSWLDMFNLHCVVERKLEKDYHEYMSHFRHWFFKVDRSKKPPTPAEVKKVSRNTAQSKNLLAKYASVV